MKPISFAQAEHPNKKKVTRRKRFLARMEALVPSQRLINALSPSCFPNAAGKRGRPPIGLERRRRIYFLQQWSFGMKSHIGVDAVSGLTHRVAATSANVVDVIMAGALVQEDDKRVSGDAG